jgi:hypothetical protein
MTSKKHRVQSFLITFFGTIIFLVVSTYVLLWANGVKFDPETKTFEKTVVVAVDAKITNVEIFLNDKKIATQAPIQKRGLAPGRYDLKITREGFHPYHKTFVLQGGEVGIETEIKLIAVSPLITDLPADAKFIGNGNLSAGLSLDNGALYDSTRFVTRFATVPSKVYRFNNAYLYQIGESFRIYFPESNQDFLVYTTSAPEQVEVNLAPFSWAFSVDENGAKKLVNLTIATEAEANLTE